jgi:hypothetical protein
MQGKVPKYRKVGLWRTGRGGREEGGRREERMAHTSANAMLYKSEPRKRTAKGVSCLFEGGSQRLVVIWWGVRGTKCVEETSLTSCPFLKVGPQSCWSFGGRVTKNGLEESP